MVASRAGSVVPVSARRTRKASAHRVLARNIVIAGVTLGSLAVTSAGLALFGTGQYAGLGYAGFGFGALPRDGVRHNGLQIALADPAPPVVVRHDPRIPIETPEPAVRVAATENPPAESPQTANPPAASPPASVPTPPRRERAHGAAKTDTTVAAPLTFPRPLAELAPPLPPAPPQEELALAFADPGITGSLGGTDAQEAMPGKVAAAPPMPAKPEVTKAELPKPVLARPEPPKPLKPARALTPHEKLYGPVRLASLTPAGASPDTTDDVVTGLPRAPYDRNTAVYVIGSKRVYLPDGSSLEAHSGLGQYMDDPRYVHLRMRGATPPHVYTMKMREALFHGVEAIRLTPIGGEKAIHGRDGLLAHTYMLGPSGQSNGCVSFKDYRTFLNAFKSGKISRLAVIARLD